MHVSTKEKASLYKDIIFATFRKKKRNNIIVKNEYEDGIYKKARYADLWKDHKNIPIWIINNPDKIFGNNMLYFKHNDVLLKDSQSNIAKLWETEYIKSISRFIKNADQIVELGCGYGRNLFALRKNGFSNQLEGYDISQNAISLANNFNKQFDTNITFDVLDFMNINTLDLQGKTIFTYAALEQTKYILDKIIIDLINLKPKQIIHFETIPKLIKNNIDGFMTKLYRYNKDYQTDILNIIKKDKRVNITHLERFNVTASPFNPIMFVRYEIKQT